MREKMNLQWGIEQMERELLKNHSAASNIMNICTEVLKQVEELEAGRQSAQKELDDLKAEHEKELREAVDKMSNASDERVAKIRAEHQEQVRKLKEVIESKS